MENVTESPVCELTPDYVLSDKESGALRDALASVNADPYRQYDAFHFQVGRLIQEGAIPQSVLDAFSGYASEDHTSKPFIFVRNLPVDDGVPLFDNTRAVHSKYELKKTFIAEGVLSLSAHLTAQTPIGYLNVNGGDVFQDIYPMTHMQETQSQKALGPIFFHKDLANHYVRPDYVNMISMRATPKNAICTTFVRNVDVFAELTAAEIEEFRQVQFHTPFDDLTVHSGKHDVGEADKHPIISGDNDLRFFENRTVGTSPRAQELVVRLTEVLHKVKCRVQMCPGDFIGVENNNSVHGKEIGDLAAPDEAWSRWTLKTVNVSSIEPHRDHLVPGTEYLIAG